MSQETFQQRLELLVMIQKCNIMMQKLQEADSSIQNEEASFQNTRAGDFRGEIRASLFFNRITSFISIHTTLRLCKQSSNLPRCFRCASGIHQLQTEISTASDQEVQDCQRLDMSLRTINDIERLTFGTG